MSADMSEDDEFVFAKPKAALTEVAIVNVEGGTHQGTAKHADFVRLMDVNRQAVVEATFQKLGIKCEHWGDSVEPRPVFIEGFSKPWKITVATLKSADVARSLFGADGERTHPLQIKVQMCTDLKEKKYVPHTIEVEAGLNGALERFLSIGGRGRRIATNDIVAHGTMLTVTLDRNPRAWEYKDPEWQTFAARCAKKHVYHALGSMRNPVNLVTPIDVVIFSTEAMLPFQSGVKFHQMSAKGVRIHLLVKGVYFHTNQARATLLPAGPIPLDGQFPTGEVDVSGLVPQKGNVRARYHLHGDGLMKDTRQWQNEFYCQAALEMYPDAKRGMNIRAQHKVGLRQAKRERRRQEAGSSSTAPLEEGEVMEPASKAARTAAESAGMD